MAKKILWKPANGTVLCFKELFISIKITNEKRSEKTKTTKKEITGKLIAKRQKNKKSPKPKTS